MIGNSLTFVPAMPALGWTHDGGMAASDAAHDFVHLVAAQRGLTLAAARNEASIERNLADPINSIDLTTPMAQLIAGAAAGIDAKTAVVVELGDNVAESGVADFAVNYGRLLDAVVAAKPAKLLCTSRWWQLVDVDDVLKAACVAHGGTFVDIGDIYPTRADVPLPGEDPATSIIWTHPHDASMAEIARRVAAAL